MLSKVRVRVRVRVRIRVRVRVRVRVRGRVGMEVGLLLECKEWVRVHVDETFIVFSLISPQVRGVTTWENASRLMKAFNAACKAGTSPFALVELPLSLLTMCTLMVGGGCWL